MLRETWYSRASALMAAPASCAAITASRSCGLSLCRRNTAGSAGRLLIWRLGQCARVVCPAQASSSRDAEPPLRFLRPTPTPDLVPAQGLARLGRNLPCDRCGLVCRSGRHRLASGSGTARHGRRRRLGPDPRCSTSGVSAASADSWLRTELAGGTRERRVRIRPTEGTDRWAFQSHSRGSRRDLGG